MTEPVVEGDPFGIIKNEKSNPYPAPQAVNDFHTRSDADVGPGAIHHTLGISHNQASAGDHVHDGLSSRKLGQSQGFTVANLSTTDAVRIQSIITLLHKFIDFGEV